MLGWEDPEIPKCGWTCAGTEDLKKRSGICRMSGTSIRYVHIMVHPQYDGELAAGCICAGLMEGDMEAAKSRDEEMRKQSVARNNLAVRRKNFPDLKGWRVASNGNRSLRKDGSVFRVFNTAGRWGGMIKDPAADDDQVDWVPGRFDSPEDAMLATFDMWAVDRYGSDYKPGWQGAKLWKPAAGDELEGVVVRTVVENGKFGDYPVLYILDDTGMVWRVQCFATRLRRRVEMLNVQAGFLVQIRYHGRKNFTTNVGEQRDYHDYDLRIHSSR